MPSSDERSPSAEDTDWTASQLLVFRRLTRGRDLHASIRDGADTAPPSLEGLPILALGEGASVVDRVPPERLLLGERLGQGGMGTVHVARQAALDRDVAVKRPREDAPPRMWTALVREARITGRLEHPNILPIHGLGLDERGLPVLVMKRVAGARWSELIADANHPAWASWVEREEWLVDRHVRVLLEVCKAVAFAHGQGIAHRDIKPDNVMIGRHGEVYLLDWGIAAPLGHPIGAPVGTPAYMAPEMIDATSLCAVTMDVYMLGACLRDAIRGAVRRADGGAAREREPINPWVLPDVGPDVPHDLAEICRRALAISPMDRLPDVGALRAALLGYLRHQASRQLARAATAELSRLIALLDGGASDVVALNRAFAAASFGLRQALNSWPNNAEARAALGTGLRAMAEHGLRREDPDGVEVLAAELRALGEDTEALDASVAAARERLAARHGVLALADVQRFQRERNGWLLFLAVATLLSYGYSLIIQRWPETTWPVMLWSMPSFVLLIGGVAWLKRRTILGSAVNRRVVAVVLLVCVGSSIHRVLAWASGRETMQMTLLVELFAIACSLTVAGTMHRYIMAAALPFWVILPVAWLVPGMEGPSMALSLPLGALVAAGWWTLDRRRQERPARP